MKKNNFFFFKKNNQNFNNGVNHNIKQSDKITSSGKIKKTNKVENGPSNILKALNQKKAEGINPLGMLVAPREKKEDREKESENFLSEELKTPVNPPNTSVTQPLMQQQGSFNQYFSLQGQLAPAQNKGINYSSFANQDSEMQKGHIFPQEQLFKPLQQNQSIKSQQQQQQASPQTFWQQASNETSWKGTKPPCFPPSKKMKFSSSL